MPRLKYSEFQAHVQEGGLAPLYVLAGEESFFQREALAVLKRGLFDLEDGETPPPGSVTVLDGSLATPADVLDELATQGFFAEVKLVVVEGAGAFLKAHRPDADFLRRLRERPPGAVLVLITRTLDGRTTFARQATEYGVVVACEPLSTREATPKLRAWIGQRAKHYGLGLARGADDVLVERVGISLGSLDQELVKLAVYLADRGERPIVRGQDVEALIHRNRAFLGYELTDAVVRGKRGEALRLAGELIAQGMRPQAVIGALGAQFRRLWLIRQRLGAGASPADACREAGVHQQFLWQRTAQAARSRNEEALAYALGLISEADRTLKGQSPSDLGQEPALLVEMLVMKLSEAPQPMEAR